MIFYIQLNTLREGHLATYTEARCTLYRSGKEGHLMTSTEVDHYTAAKGRRMLATITQKRKGWHLATTTQKSQKWKGGTSDDHYCRSGRSIRRPLLQKRKGGASGDHYWKIGREEHLAITTKKRKWSSGDHFTEAEGRNIWRPLHRSRWEGHLTSSTQTH